VSVHSAARAELIEIVFNVHEILVNAQDNLLNVQDNLLNVQDILLNVQDIFLNVQDIFLNVQDNLLNVQDNLLNDIWVSDTRELQQVKSWTKGMAFCLACGKRVSLYGPNRRFG
jgi:hypothetical protein